MEARAAVASCLLLAFGPSARFTETHVVCSRRPFTHFRTTNHVYFTGTATRDTVPATAGRVRTDLSLGAGHFGRGRPHPLYGQVVIPERVGKPWSALVPPNSRQIILVPWDYAADCRPVHWSRTAAWITPGLRSLLHGTMRDSSEWVEGVPTLDVFAPEQLPFPVADSGSDRNTWPRVPPRNRLTIDEGLGLFEVLPSSDSMTTSPAEAMRPLVDWANDHPDLVDKWPAVDALRVHRIGLEDQLVRLRPSPIAGTYRFTVTRPGIDTVTVYARTETHPMSTLRSTRRREVSRVNLPIVGYYLMTKCALTEEALPVDRADRRAVECYQAVSVERSGEGPDSLMWRGDSDAPKGSWILLHGQASPSMLASLFRHDLRDSTSYFMPGTWIEYADGRVRYDWTARNGDTVFVSVRGERISREVLRSTPR